LKFSRDPSFIGGRPDATRRSAMGGAEQADILVADSITKLDPSWRGKVAIAASHGGVYPGYLAAKAHLRGVVLHDAGLGLDRAGIASLDYLDALGLAAATIDYRSARIGDGADMAARGVVSFVNRAAEALGCKPGEECRAAARKMLAAAPFAGEAPPYDEGRFRLRAGEPPVWGLDSNSLARPEDRGAVLVTGSHGALLGGKAASAVGVAALAAVYHDAGIGIDRAGVSRLPALEARGIAGATVAGDTARIGDARSIWETGRLSAVNRIAEDRGARVGMAVPDFAAAMRAGRRPS
jgi:hypothetical protein